MDYRAFEAACNAAMAEAARVRRLARARENRALKRLMATPEWQAAHALACAEHKARALLRRFDERTAEVRPMRTPSAPESH